MTTILWLPGWSFDEKVFSRFYGAFDSDFRHLHVNWQGLENKEDIKNRVHAVMDQADGDKLFAVGWSLGAMAALELALGNQSKLKGLALISPTASFVKRENYDFGWDKRVVQRMQKQLHKDKQKVLTDFAGSLLNTEEGVIADLKQNIPDDSATSLAAGLDYLTETDLRSQIVNLKIPTIIFHGREDLICPPAASQFIKDEAGGYVRRIVMENIGHIPFMTEKQSVEIELALCFKELAE